MEDVGAKGYHVKVTKVTPSTPPPGIEIEVDDDN